MKSLLFKALSGTACGVNDCLTRAIAVAEPKHGIAMYGDPALPPDFVYGKWVEFTLREEARFSDGTPITPEDVIWTYKTLATVGHGRYRGSWEKVESIAKTGFDKVRITFKKEDRETGPDHGAASDPEKGPMGRERFYRKPTSKSRFPRRPMSSAIFRPGSSSR